MNEWMNQSINQWTKSSVIVTSRSRFLSLEVCFILFFYLFVHSLTDLFIHVFLLSRDWGTAATVASGVLLGAHVLRVHDVQHMYNVIRVAEAICVVVTSTMPRDYTPIEGQNHSVTKKSTLFQWTRGDKKNKAIYALASLYKWLTGARN
jgi:hypothetical protein